jgi:hypothetical protein
LLKGLAKSIGQGLTIAINAVSKAFKFLYENGQLVLQVLAAIVALKLTAVFLSLGKAIAGIVPLLIKFWKGATLASVATSFLSGNVLAAGINIAAMTAAFVAAEKAIEKYQLRLFAPPPDSGKPPEDETDPDEPKTPEGLMKEIMDATAGIKEGTAAAYEEWSQTTKELFSSTAKGITSTLLESTDAVGEALGLMIAEGKSFKESMSQIWKDLKKQVIVQIAQMMVKMLAMLAIGLAIRAVMPWLGGGNAAAMPDMAPLKTLKESFSISKMFGKGGVTNSLSVPSFANGGITTAPQLAVIGDNPNNREAIVPLPDGKSIPVDMQGSGVQSIGQLNILPDANIDQALMEKPMSYWVDLVQEKILPAMNSLGQTGATTSLEYRASR